MAAEALETVYYTFDELIGSLSFIRVLELSELTLIIETFFVGIDGPVHYHNHEPRSSKDQIRAQAYD